MKQPIFILSSLLCICIAQHAVASDYLEEAEPVEMSVIDEEVIDMDNIQLSDDEYFTETMDDIAETRARVDELLIPRETTHNLWTSDPIVFDSGDESVQSVIMTKANLWTPRHMRKPVKKKQKETFKANNVGFTLGEQSYYGETVYIINNFLSENGDNVSETDGLYTGTKNNPKYSDCPFDTQIECDIWLRKPIISETVAPRSKNLRDDVMCEITDAIEKKPNISANEKVMAPLLNRYRVLMRASQSCCTGGITYKLQKAGASKKLIYKFLSDDANFSGFGLRCLVMNDNQIENTDKYEATAATVADVRNSCLCKSKANFKALLAPFDKLYKENPNFAKAPFEYQHYDGLGRLVKTSINQDVQNALGQMEMCP